MNSHDELIYRIAFATYRNVNYSSATRLEAKHVTPEAFFTFPASTLASITGLKPAFFADDRRHEALEAARREADFIAANHIKAIYYTDDCYPARLAECNDAPAMLFVLGEAKPDFRHVVAIVGTRHCTAYGLEFTRTLVEDIAKSLDDVLIVSGLAYGIDIAAHKAAISSGITTGAVFAHSLNTIYPADHRDAARRIIAEGGFLATEYRTCETIHRGNFLARNRIVAGMADATVVVESDERGGAMSTASIASAYNREVFAVPGRVYDPASRGCNALIARRQASIIRSADDLIDIMGWTPKPQTGEQQEFSFGLDATQQTVVDFIRKNPTATVNDMCVALAQPYSQMGSILFEMEMADIIVSLPGGRYGVILKS
ncbi:MAG: DNA-processing protein DprA [Muribaculaceae bacterium]|nr:DNA-processing protein DprA [Muribaculaceae bacterium]MDE6565352.1 DNA-processing protein DprA [Muribaculaceae bacterium]